MHRDRLSKRGRRLLATPPLPEYIREHFARQSSTYDPANPGGYIPLSVAENLLLGDRLIDRMAAVGDVPAAAVTPEPSSSDSRYSASCARSASSAISSRPSARPFAPPR